MKQLIYIISLLFFTHSYAQELRVYNVKNSKTRPRMVWYRTGKDTLYKDFKVFRAKLKQKQFDTIATAHFVFTKKDTVKYIVIDTTLTEKAIYRYYIQVKSKDNKTLTSPVVMGHNMGYIPKPRLVEFYANKVKDRKAIELHWKLNHHFSVRSLSLFRSSYGNKNFEKITELSGDATTYTDIVPLSHHNYYYFILIADYFGYEQPSAVYPASSLFKQKAIPPQNIKLLQNNDKITLKWSNTDRRLSGYQVFRSIGKGEFLPLQTMVSSNLKNEHYTDTITGISGKNIRYYVVNYSDSYTASVPSDTLQIYIPGKDKKPLPPAELDIVNQDEGHIKLLWTKPDDKQVAGYNVYMEKPVKKQLNNGLIPVTHNYFENIAVKKGETYAFSVESVGISGQKSTYKTPASINLLPEYNKLIVEVTKQPEGIKIQWKHLPGTDISKILLYRQALDKSPLLLKTFDNTDTTYTDTKVAENTTYVYTVYGQKKNGEKIALNEGVKIRY